MAALSYQRHQTMTVIPGVNAVAFTDDSSEYGAPYVIARSFRFKFSNSRHSRPGPHGSRRRDTPPHHEVGLRAAPDALILRGCEAMTPVSRTRCSVLHGAPQSRNPRRCGAQWTRIDSAP